MTADAIPLAFALLLFVVAVLLAWRNLQSNRGDLRGARRMTAVIVVLYLVRWLGSGRHTPVLATELELLALGLSRALAIAVFVSILYLALEPYVRRRWPQSLVSWSRLLAGRVRDPMVARDVLIAELSLAGTVVVAALILVPSLAGRLVPLRRELLPLLGMRQVIGSVAGAPMLAIQSGMIFRLLLLLTQSIGRRRIGGLLFAAAAGVLMLSWWGAQTGGSFGTGALPIAFVGLFFFLLTRLGLLAAVVAMHGSALALLLPDVVSFSAWHSYCFAEGLTWIMVPIARRGWISAPQRGSSRADALPGVDCPDPIEQGTAGIANRPCRAPVPPPEAGSAGDGYPGRHVARSCHDGVVRCVGFMSDALRQFKKLPRAARPLITARSGALLSSWRGRCCGYEDREPA